MYLAGHFTQNPAPKHRVWLLAVNSFPPFMRKLQLLRRDGPSILYCVYTRQRCSSTGIRGKTLRISGNT